MNNQKKWLIGIIVILVLMNITMLAFFWLGKRPPNPTNITNHFAKELNLSAAQKATFEASFESHFENTKKVLDSTRVYKEKTLTILVQADRNKAELERTIQKVGVLEAKRAEILVTHFLELEKACESEEQVKKLREVFKKSLPKPKHGHH